MTLSDKMVEYDSHQKGYFEEDIKQFIKDLKEISAPTVAGPWMAEQIDKLAGDRLI